MNEMVLGIWVLGPLVWAVTSLVGALPMQVSAAWIGRMCGVGGLLFMASAVLLAILEPAQSEWFGRWVMIDSLTLVMMALIGFLGWVVARFSIRYLDGDAGQVRFFCWLAATLLSVSVLVSAGDLVVLVVAWVATSLSLHRLLTYYGDRPGAVISARKKFLFSRVGDLAIIGAVALLVGGFGTSEIRELVARGGGVDVGGVWFGSAILLIAIAAILKSAQFPFHSWLPDTLETPTPVSALMHAGVVSAGGFLLIRLSPLVDQFAPAMWLLAGVGAVTAVFGSFVMMTQTSVKKALAFSTVAQMGYMILQCGLGMFGLAALHLVAHSLYKAHAFLNTGEAVRQKPAFRADDSGSGLKNIWWGLAVFALSLVGVLAFAWVIGVPLGTEPGIWVLISVVAMGVTTVTTMAAAKNPTLLGLGVAASVGACGLVFLFHSGAKILFAGVVPAMGSRVATNGDWVVSSLVFLLFLAALVFQLSLPAIRNHPFGRTTYVLMANRLYVGALVNRAILKIWPIRNS